MAHEETRNILDDTMNTADNSDNKTMLEQLNDANHEIEGLKIQLAWFERSCDDL